MVHLISIFKEMNMNNKIFKLTISEKEDNYWHFSKIPIETHMELFL